MIHSEESQEQWLEHDIDNGDHLRNGLDLSYHLSCDNDTLGRSDKPDAGYHELSEDNDAKRPCRDPSEIAESRHN